MEIGFIPSAKTAEGGVQPASGDPDRERRINVAEAAFADRFDLRAIEIDRWSWPEGLFPEQRAEFELLDQYDLRIACVGLWGAPYLDPEAGDRAEDELERAIAFAETVEADVFVTGTEVPADMDDETAWDEGLAYYGELTDRIAARGLEVAYYFGHGEQPLLEYDMDALARFTEAIPNAGLKVDPANLLFAGLDPTAVLDRFGDRVTHFHIKDALIIEDDGERRSVDQPPAGLGDVPWGNVIDLLYLADYDGVLSIEPHGAQWGHGAPDDRRRDCIRMAQEHVAQFLRPRHRPAYLQ